MSDAVRAGERVCRLVDAADQVYASRAELTKALLESTGLSPEGLEFAWERSFERAISDAQRTSLLARSLPRDAVLVVLSANVFVAPVRALACALAQSARVFVKPSKREPHVVRALLEAAPDLGIEVLSDESAASFAGEVHVYGRAETIAAYRASLPSASVLVPHGPGFGVAYVAAQDDLKAAAASVANDVVLFDQRGCMSPRMTYVAGDRARAAAFGRALHAALEAHAVPRGRLATEEIEEIRAFSRTMDVVGELLEGESATVAIADVPGTPVLAPVGRNMFIAPVETVALDLLGSYAPYVTVVGTNEDAPWRPRGARLSRLGEMQTPPLDGPVDLRGEQVSTS